MIYYDMFGEYFKFSWYLDTSCSVVPREITTFYWTLDKRTGHVCSPAWFLWTQTLGTAH